MPRSREILLALNLNFFIKNQKLQVGLKSANLSCWQPWIQLVFWWTSVAISSLQIYADLGCRKKYKKEWEDNKLKRHCHVITEALRCKQSSNNKAAMQVSWMLVLSIDNDDCSGTICVPLHFFFYGPMCFMITPGANCREHQLKSKLLVITCQPRHPWLPDT